MSRISPEKLQDDLRRFRRRPPGATTSSSQFARERNRKESKEKIADISVGMAATLRRPIAKL
jgi:hypothetical protein